MSQVGAYRWPACRRCSRGSARAHFPAIPQGTSTCLYEGIRPEAAGRPRLSNFPKADVSPMASTAHNQLFFTAGPNNYANGLYGFDHG